MDVSLTFDIVPSNSTRIIFPLGAGIYMYKQRFEWKYILQSYLQKNLTLELTSKRCDI